MFQHFSLTLHSHAHSLFGDQEVDIVMQCQATGFGEMRLNQWCGLSELT